MASLLHTTAEEITRYTTKHSTDACCILYYLLWLVYLLLYANVHSKCLLQCTGGQLKGTGHTIARRLSVLT